MNRKQRRDQIRNYAKSEGIKFKQAKKIVNDKLTDPNLYEGQKVKLNYEFIIRQPDWKNQRDDFRQWIEDHKDDMFTIERTNISTKMSNKAVTLKEDTTNPKWLISPLTLTPIATATIKLDSGKEIAVSLDNITDMNDPKIQEKINEALEEE